MPLLLFPEKGNNQTFAKEIKMRAPSQFLAEGKHDQTGHQRPKFQPLLVTFD